MSVDPSAAALLDEVLIDDDGVTQWASPTQGPPIELRYVPPDSQWIVCLRPAELRAHAEGERIRAALGPTGDAGISWIEAALGVPLARVERLAIAWQISGARGGDQVNGSPSRLEPTVIAEIRPTMSRDELLSRHAGASAEMHGGETLLATERHAYYMPADAPGTIIMGPRDRIEQIIEAQDSEPPMRRELEQLLAASDADRHVTLFLLPSIIDGEASTMLQGDAARLMQAADWLLRDGIAAVSLSAHWGDDFFYEILALPTPEVPARLAANRLVAQVQQLPDRLEAHIASLELQPYSRRLLIRLPAMVRALSRFTRASYDQELTTLRGYLPVAAGHNLLMAGELVLAERAVGSPPPPAITTSLTPPRPPTVAERLARPVTLRFPHETLETALQMLAEEAGLALQLAGADLETEGITKNQSLAIDMADRPAGEVLAEILRLANPDKSAAGLTDARQKLVYVMRPSADPTEGAGEVIVVTTRAAALQRGEPLPPAFRSP